MDKRVLYVRTHSDQQGRNRCAVSRMNHTKKTREMAFPRPSKKQSERETQRWSSAAEQSCVCVCSAHARLDEHSAQVITDVTAVNPGG